MCATLLLPWLFGIDRLTRDADDAVRFAIFLGINGLIAWRARSAVEIAWGFLASPDVGRADAPTWPHVLGALGLGAGLVLSLLLASTLPLYLAGRESDVDSGAVARSVLVFTVVLYIFWPAIVM